MCDRGCGCRGEIERLRGELDNEKLDAESEREYAEKVRLEREELRAEVKRLRLISADIIEDIDADDEPGYDWPNMDRARAALAKEEGE